MPTTSYNNYIFNQTFRTFQTSTLQLPSIVKYYAIEYKTVVRPNNLFSYALDKINFKITFTFNFKRVQFFFFFFLDNLLFFTLKWWTVYKSVFFSLFIELWISQLWEPRSGKYTDIDNK